MRLTVGPHPAAIYWRRRAVVAAVVALIIIVFVATCTGPDTGGPVGQSGPSASTSVSASRSASNPPTLITPDANATNGGSGGGGGGGASGGASPSVKGGSDPGDDGADSGTGGGDLPADAPPCADTDMALTAEVAPSPGKYGGTVSLTLVVRNTSTLACSRDVGSTAQELRVIQGTATIWSSDNCQTTRTADVRVFGPNIESRFSTQWYTYRLAPRECEVAPNPAPAGRYQVLARLGTKLSTPLNFDIAI
jgi:hypothetical protein